jgi:uncharacterized protein (TIGR04255 family)
MNMSSRVHRFELERAPLVYVVAQVKFSTVENIAKSIPDFQDKVRKNGYPRMTAGHLTSLTFSPQSAVPEMLNSPRWDFHDRERRAGLVLTKDAISIHVTNYSNFDEFCKRVKAALDILDETVGPALIERLGLRYVDLVRLEDGRHFYEYVNGGLLGITDRKVEAIKSSCMVNYVAETEIGILAVRSLQRADGQIFPPDLHPMTLTQPVAAIPLGEKFLTLDFDHYSDFQSSPMEFSSAKVADRLWRLHDNITLAFLASTTSVALSEWGQRESLAEWAHHDTEAK